MGKRLLKEGAGVRRLVIAVLGEAEMVGRRQGEVVLRHSVVLALSAHCCSAYSSSPGRNRID